MNYDNGYHDIATSDNLGELINKVKTEIDPALHHLYFIDAYSYSGLVTELEGEFLGTYSFQLGKFVEDNVEV
jgi:hypothetical protein